MDLKNDLIVESICEGWNPEPDLTVSQWSDEYRFLSAKGSSEPGKFRVSRTPFLKDIMDDLSAKSPVERVVFMKGAQIGGTEAGSNWLGYIIHLSPGPVLCVQPTVDIAKRFSRQRIAPLIEECKPLKNRIKSAKSRDSGNSIMSKEFLGGILILAGANSAAGLRSMPIRYLFLDEVDAYPSDVDGEGDPVSLAERRTTTFSRRKIFLVSTPTIKGHSRIEHEYENSDMRRYYIPCPHCKQMDWLRFEDIRWPEGMPDAVYWQCPSCKEAVPEKHKNWMFSKGQWIATKKSDGRTRGYHLSSLYSPLGWKSWSSIAHEFLQARKNPAMLKTWRNTVLGETWEEEYSTQVDSEHLSNRAEAYQPGTAPLGVMACTAGVDVQDNRLVVSIWGWGRDEECWLIWHQEVLGDPAKFALWDQIAHILDMEIPNPDGKILKVWAAAVDTGGHYTHEAYVFCRNRRQQRTIAIKGSSSRNKPIINRPSKLDINYKGQTIKRGIDLWSIGTDTAKTTLMARLKQDEMCHFPFGMPKEYYDQLTAEKQISRVVKGYAKTEWIKTSARNEALDCFVYAYACLHYLYLHFNRKTIWNTLEKQLKTFKKNEVVEEPEEKPEVTEDNLTVIPKKRTVKRSASKRGYSVTSW